MALSQKFLKKYTSKDSSSIRNGTTDEVTIGTNAQNLVSNIKLIHLDNMEICKTDYIKVIRYLSDASKMYRLSEKARHQDRARQMNNLVLKLKRKRD